MIINKNRNEDINEVNKKDNKYKMNNNNIIENKELIIDDQIKKEEFNNIHDNDTNYINQQKINEVLPSKLFHFNKITISLDNTNKNNYYSKTKINNIEKEIMKNIKNMNNKDKLRSKSNRGYPKIVTNNGERIITSIRPMNNNKQFISYTCPSILALNNCVQKIYRNKTIKKLQQRQ